MNILLWVLQGFLAVMMLMPGFMKLSNTNAQLIQKGNGRMDWAEDVSPGGMKIIGLLEVLAAIGLILPMSTGIYPVLTVWAAIGVILIMIGAIALHLRRGDGAKSWGVNILILLIAAFVVYGRSTLLL
ncbi:MAG: DoxX family protein [Bacteroidetes bacterium]|nr:DoxX family protein [Bacteroidota bacterium]